MRRKFLLKANGYTVATESSAKTYLGISSGENPSVAKTVYIGNYSDLPASSNYATLTANSSLLFIQASDSVEINNKSAKSSTGLYTGGSKALTDIRAENSTGFITVYAGGAETTKAILTEIYASASLSAHDITITGIFSVDIPMLLMPMQGLMRWQPMQLTARLPSERRIPMLNL